MTSCKVKTVLFFTIMAVAAFYQAECRVLKEQAPGESVDDADQSRLDQPVVQERTESDFFRFPDNPDEKTLAKRGCCQCGTHHCCGSMCHG